MSEVRSLYLPPSISQADAPDPASLKLGGYECRFQNSRMNRSFSGAESWRKRERSSSVRRGLAMSSQSLYFGSRRRMRSRISSAESLWRGSGVGVGEGSGEADIPSGPEDGPSTWIFFAAGSEDVAQRFFWRSRPSVETLGGSKSVACSIAAPTKLPWRELTSSRPCRPR